MSIVDKAIAAITPPESEESRMKAREKARACAESGDWLSMILDHHLQIEDAFAAVKAAAEPEQRMRAQKRLAVILTGHAQAEEAAVYPILAQCGEKGHAGMGYTEQAAVKMQMAELENIDPMSQAYLDKLGHIEGAVKHHVFEEEGTWYPHLQENADQATRMKLTEKYSEEVGRYLGQDADMDGAPGASTMAEPRSFATDLGSAGDQTRPTV